MTFCLSSLLFILTIDLFAEVSEAKSTKSLPVIPNETRKAEGLQFSGQLQEA